MKAEAKIKELEATILRLSAGATPPPPSGHSNETMPLSADETMQIEELNKVSHVSFLSVTTIPWCFL